VAILTTIGGRLRESTSMLSVLHDYPGYRRFWLGNLAAVSSQQMMWIAQSWLVYELTDSVLYLGYAGLISALPAIMLNLVGGVLADRFDQRKLIRSTQVVTAIVVCTLATMTAFEVIEAWHVLVGAFITGSIQAFNQPVRQTIFPQLIDRKDMVKAVSVNSMIWQGTRMIAPATGGVVVAAFGVAATLYLCSFGFILLGILVMGLNVQRAQRRERSSMLADVKGGFGFIRDNSLFAFLIGMTFFNSFFGVANLQLMPAFARDILDVGPSGLGLLYSANGVGSFLGIIVVGSLGDFERKGLLMVGGATAFGGCLLVFAASTLYPLSLVALFFVGLFNSVYTISIQTTLQMRVPDELRGRVMGIYGMTWQVAPLGSMQASAFAALAGPQAAVAFGATMVAAFAVGVASMNSQVRRLQAAPVAN
jgi:MFS family permease